MSLLRPTTLTACLLLSVPLYAQTPATDADRADREDAADETPRLTRDETIYVKGEVDVVPSESSVGTKLSVPLEKTPLSISVVGAPIIHEQNGVTVNDALTNVAGANVMTQNGVHDYFVLRGYDSLATGLILTDGAPEPEATYYQLYNIDRVEVLKGPGSFLYGTGNPVAATVNLSRKQPERASVLDQTLSLGSWDTLRYRLDYNLGEAGPVSFRFNGLYGRSDLYRDDLEAENVGINPALTWWIDDRRSLRANLELLRNDVVPDAGLPIVGGAVAPVPRTTSYGSPFDFSEQELLRLRVDYEEILGNAWTLRNKLYYTDLDWLSDGTVLAAVLGDVVFRALINLDNEQSIAGNQLEAYRQGERHGLLLGLEASRTTDEFTIDFGLLPAMQVTDPRETATSRPDPLPGLGQAGDAESVVVAPYAMDRIALGNRVQLFVGARFDMLDYEDRANGTDTSDDELSPMLGLTYQASPRVSLYGNFIQGFAPPPSRVVGERQPEESEQTELGIKGSFAPGKLVGSLALYRLDRDNIALFDNLGATALQGSQRSEGLELELVGTPGRGWRYQLAYAYTDAVLTEFFDPNPFDPGAPPIDRSGNVPPFAPEHVANLWVVKRLGSGLGLGGGARYVGEQFVDEDNLFAIDDALLWGLMAEYRLANWQFRVNVENLTDEEYDTRGFGASSVIPGDGRSVTVGVGYRR